MKKKPKTYKGKSLRLGQGGQFAKMVDAIKKKGKSAEAAKAITASVARKKYGNKRLVKWAVAGRKRAARKKK